MIKKRYILGLLLSVICITVLETMVAGERVVEEKPWKPAEEPKSVEEAKRLQEIARKEELAAEKKLEEAKKAKDTEEMRKQQALVDKAQFDWNTADAVITNLGVLQDPAQSKEMKKSAQETLENRKIEITQKIREYEKALAGTGTSTGTGTQNAVKSYQEKVATELQGLSEKQILGELKAEIDALVSGGYSSTAKKQGRDIPYSERKAMLEFLENTLNARVKTQSPEVAALKNSIVDTIENIDNLGKQKPIANNAIDKKFDLSEKITADQIRLLRKQLVKDVFEKDFKTPAERLKALNEMQKIVDTYDIYDDKIQPVMDKIAHQPDIVEAKLKEIEIAKTIAAKFNDAFVTLNDMYERIKSLKYNEQATMLKDFQNMYNKFLQANEKSPTLDAQQQSALKQKYDDVVRHAQEVDAFLKNPKQTNQTALEKDLKLAEKIPSDQIKAIMDRIELFGYTNARELTAKDIATLKDIRDAMDHFKLQKEYSDEYGFIDDLIKDATKSVISLPEGLTKEDVASTSILGEIGEKITSGVQNIKDFFVKDGAIIVKNAAEIVVYPAKKIAEGFSYIIRETGKFLQKTFTAPEFVNKMADAPEMLDDVLTSIANLDTAGGGVVKGVLRADIGIQQVLLTVVGQQDVADALGEFAKISYKEHVNDPMVQKIKRYVDKVGTVGKTLKSIMEFPKYIGEKLEQSVRTKKETASLREIDETQRLIEEERANITLAKGEANKEIPGIKQLGDLLFKLSNYVSDRVYNTNKSIETAQQDYEQARKDYFVALGVDYSANLTPQQIAGRIEQMKLSRNDNFIQATNKLADAVDQLAFAYEVLVNKLTSVETNLKFVVDAWDMIIISPDGQNTELPVIIKSIFTLRDLKLAYLEATRNGVLQMQSDVAKFKDSPSGLLADDAVTRYRRVVDDKIFETIQEYANAMNQIDRAIAGQKEFIESKLPKVVDETSGSSSTGTGNVPPPDTGGGGWD